MVAELARFELANRVRRLRHFQWGLPKSPHFGTCMRLNFNSTRTRLPLLLNSSLTEPCFWKCRSLRSGNAATSVVALRLFMSAFIWMSPDDRDCLNEVSCRFVSAKGLAAG